MSKILEMVELPILIFKVGLVITFYIIYRVTKTLFRRKKFMEFEEFSDLFLPPQREVKK